jgi:hypothetical protein
MKPAATALWQPVMIAFAPSGDVYIAEGHANEPRHRFGRPANNSAPRRSSISTRTADSSTSGGNEVGQENSARRMASPSIHERRCLDRRPRNTASSSIRRRHVLKTMQMRNLVCALYFDSRGQPWMASGQDGQF